MNRLKIDGFETISEFVTEENSDLKDVLTKDTHWFAKHVISSQYLLQIVKCKDLNCCSPRSNYFVLLEHFLPAPIPL